MSLQQEEVPLDDDVDEDTVLQTPVVSGNIVTESDVFLSASDDEEEVDASKYLRNRLLQEINITAADILPNDADITDEDVVKCITGASTNFQQLSLKQAVITTGDEIFLSESDEE